jgi:hypothetical protein
MTGLVPRILLSAFALMSGAAFAQSAEQTPANAQLFLKQVMEQGGVFLEVDTGEGFNMAPERLKNCDPGLREYKNPGLDENGCKPWTPWKNGRVDKYKVTSSAEEQQAGSDCVTAFHAETNSGVHKQNSLLIEWSPPPSPFRVEWNAISMVKQTEAIVALSGPTKFRFYFSSDQLAARVAYAMEFLRTSCDQTAATGF